MDEDQHIDLAPGSAMDYDQLLDRYHWRFLNHAGVPNAFFRGREFLAIRPIQAWEEVTFNYDTTEYALSCPFPCWCGHPSCRGRMVRGSRHLLRDERERLRPWLADHLRRRLAEFTVAAEESSAA